MLAWRRHLLPGDYLVVIAGAALCAALFPLFWQNTAPQRAIIRANGELFAEVDLAIQKSFTVPGPLGSTVIRVEPGRARVVSDPSPRQYCVLQGWLKHSGDIALCAPNQVSVQVLGRDAPYDSLSY